MAVPRLLFVPAAAAIEIATDKAVSIGVIVTELLTNASKYAYGSDHRGEIRARVKAESNRMLEVAVEDDGVGWNGSGEIRGSGGGIADYPGNDPVAARRACL